MAITKIQYTGDGSTVNYTFTFEYINETDVKVEIDGVSTTAYSFANATTLTFDSAPANGAAILIYRDTDIDSLDATFFPGSAIKAEDLNSNFTQNNFAVQEIQANTWDNERETIHSDETWISSNEQIATTAAIDARFHDVDTDTVDSSDTWVSNDNVIATTQAIENRIDEIITSDIGTDGTGITVTDDGDGTITLGLADNSIDFSKIKDDDIITAAEQDAGVTAADTNIFSASGAARRFDTLVQTSTPSGSDWEVGKTWLVNDQERLFSIWDGSSWLGVTSGGTFTTQPKVVYVDASSGDDANDGHRISRPKKTIKAAVQQINNDATYGDGSVVVVAPGTYQEEAPIDITKANVSIIGQALRSCIVHPTIATEENSLFRVNSGSFLSGLTFTGIKASGALGNTVDPDLPVNQGWNVSFYPGATIIKSPYIQNCTNFSDSEINNSNLDVITPAGGAAGDTDSQPTGGGLLVDGSVVDSNSPLRSMVCDSYTHVGLNGPGILVTNNGYAQCTSSYAFFNRYHIKCLNGGQANLAASTTDFGDEALVADGRSTSAIFTSTTTATANDNDVTFTIAAPTIGATWHGSALRPQSNMLVDIGGNTYPILSSTANGAGWDVTISRPNPNDRNENLGLDGAVASGAAVSFYLRSQIASSGHTMEYVGSGTNYSALPENGGVPDDSKQIVESNNGKVWTAITDHNGKFKVGDTFQVDQVTGFVQIPDGALSVGVLLEDLDVNGYNIIDTSGNVNINDTLDMNSNKIVNVTDPTANQDAATKSYVDTAVSSLNAITTEIQTVAGISSEVVTVAGDSANVNLVGDNITNVNTVAGVSGDVTTVANSIAKVTTVADNITDVITVANDLSEAISEVETVADDLNEAVSEIEVVANNISNVNAVGNDITNVNTVAGNTTNIDTVAGISANVTTVAGNNANVTTVAGVSGDVTTVAGISADVTTVADNTTNINTVASNDANVTTVAGINADVTAVSNISSNVTVVSNNNANVTTVATNIADVNTVATDISNVNTVATNVADINTAATYLNAFNGLYLGPLSSDPSFDTFGNPVSVGDFYFNTVSSQVRYYNGTVWQSSFENSLEDFAFANADFSSVYTAAVGSNTIDLGGLAVSGGAFDDENIPTNRMALAAGTTSYNLGSL